MSLDQVFLEKNVPFIENIVFLLKQIIKHMFFIGDVFPKKLGLDSILESWDLKIRIPRRKLRIWSYSQVETRRYRSKYQKSNFLIVSRAGGSPKKG